MRRETIISKGYYTYPQTSGLIAVRQYIVLLRNNEKQLLLRLTNERGEAVTGYTLRVLQYYAAGALVGTQTVEESGVSYKPKATFGMSREIPLSEDCVDFRVTVLSVACGSYVHTLKG